MTAKIIEKRLTPLTTQERAQQIGMGTRQSEGESGRQALLN